MGGREPTGITGQNQVGTKGPAKAQMKPKPSFLLHFPCLVAVVSLWCMHIYRGLQVHACEFKVEGLQELLVKRQGIGWLCRKRGTGEGEGSGKSHPNGPGWNGETGGVHLYLPLIGLVLHFLDLFLHFA